MRHIITLVTVALVMAAMMAVFSTGAVAQPSCAAAPPATDTLAGPEFGPLASLAARTGGAVIGENFEAGQGFGQFVAQGSMCSPQNG
jgi:hypothetical protein